MRWCSDLADAGCRSRLSQRGEEKRRQTGGRTPGEVHHAGRDVDDGRERAGLDPSPGFGSDRKRIDHSDPEPLFDQHAGCRAMSDFDGRTVFRTCCLEGLADHAAQARGAFDPNQAFVSQIVRREGRPARETMPRRQGDDHRAARHALDVDARSRWRGKRHAEIGEAAFDHLDDGLRSFDLEIDLDARSFGHNVGEGPAADRSRHRVGRENAQVAPATVPKVLHLDREGLRHGLQRPVSR